MLARYSTVYSRFRLLFVSVGLNPRLEYHIVNISLLLLCLTFDITGRTHAVRYYDSDDKTVVLLTY